MTGIASGCRAAGCAIVGGELAEHPGLLAPGRARRRRVRGWGRRAGRHHRRPGPDRGRGRADRSAVAWTAIKRLLPRPASPARSRRAPARRARLGRVGSLDPGRRAPTTLGDLHARGIAVMEAVDVHAVAHITGGGLPGNLPRVLGDGLDAVLERDRWPLPPIFAEIQTGRGGGGGGDGPGVRSGARHGRSRGPGDVSRTVETLAGPARKRSSWEP